MANFFNKANIFLRVQQSVIVLLHLILLKWMYFALSESGALSTKEVLLHFMGMATYGALLIRGCAAWGKWQYKKSNPAQSNSGHS